MFKKVYADIPTNIIDPASGFESFGNIFGFLLNLLIGIGWSLVFVMLVLGFIQFILSKGEKSAVSSAQKWLTFAVIGGVALFFVSFIKKLIPSMLGAPNDFMQSNEFDF